MKIEGRLYLHHSKDGTVLGRNHVSQVTLVSKNVVNNSILDSSKKQTSQEVLRTYSDNAVIHLRYGGVESTARKSNEMSTK